MLVIGLTGGISSGKSTVADLFSKFGIDIIDADMIAKEVVMPNHAAYKQIVTRYGADVLTKEKLLDRKKLRAIIFSDPAEKQWLENLLHPIIIDQIKNDIKKVNSPYCILVIPLLVETNFYEVIDRILVVDTTEEIQILRTETRDQSHKENVLAIIKSQSSRADRLRVADDIIDNTGSIDFLAAQVTNLHQKYLLLAK